MHTTTDARLLSGLKALRFPDDFGQALSFSGEFAYLRDRVRKNGDLFMIREELTFEDAYTVNEEVRQLSEETGAAISDLRRTSGRGVNGHAVYEVSLPRWIDAARFLSAVTDEPELADLPQPAFV